MSMSRLHRNQDDEEATKTCQGDTLACLSFGFRSVEAATVLRLVLTDIRFPTSLKDHLKKSRQHLTRPTMTTRTTTTTTTIPPD